MYHQLAHLYDWSGSQDFSTHVLAQVQRLLDANQIHPPAQLIDLACGTGTLALALSTQGYQVLGIDLSHEMLALAQQKHVQDELAKQVCLQWQQADMREFLVDTPVDAVLCHYDSLNHLSNESELRATFIRVAQALKPGGLFIFDLNTLENYQTFWNGTDTYEGPNYRIKTNAHFDENLSQAEVHFLAHEYNDDGELSSQEETVREHYFNETAVEKYLLAADFYEIHHTVFNPVQELPADVSLKTLWHCKRR